MEKPHKKLNAWQKAVALTINLYHATDNFPSEHRFKLSSQIRRATLSIASNIAEGAARQTKKDFANFLHMAQASLSELDTQLEIAQRLKLLSQERWQAIDMDMNHLDKLLSGLIKHVRSGVRSTRSTPHPSPLTCHRP